MIPPKQRLATQDPALSEVEDWLVVQHQLFALDGSAQVGLNLQNLHGVGMHPSVE